jgi:hypothetical protein
MRRTLLTVAAALVLTAPLLAGCAGDKDGGDGVATAGGAKPAASDAPQNDGDTSDQMRRFAQCMRDNGIDMPDPQTDGEGRVLFGGPGAGEEGGTPPDREKFDAAQQACKQYLPNGGEPPKMDPADVEKVRAYARCMRENGVPDFPDPQPDGGLRIEAGPNTGIDPRGEAFQASEKKCEQYMPRRPGGDS